MNNTFVIASASLGASLWLYAVLRDRCKNSTGGTFWTAVRNMFSFREKESTQPTGGTITIDGLERELGIEPDAYLCDRISRINEALVARRDKSTPKKKGGAS